MSSANRNPVLKESLVSNDAAARSKPTLTHTQLQQLLSYARAREQEGWYYGNKAQFEKRHTAIVEWLISEIV